MRYYSCMPDEHSPSTINLSRQGATNTDTSRQIVTGDEYISIKDARQIFLEHDRKVTERTLQRYCEKQHLDGKKMLTAEGEKWETLNSTLAICRRKPLQNKGLTLRAR